MPVTSARIAIFPAHTNKICTGVLDSGLDLETDDNNDINLDLNANTIFPDRIYLKLWKDPDKADALHNEVKEELESASATRSSSAEDFAVTQPKVDVPQRSVMTSSSRSQQQSR